jgi:hypothetical protein
LITLVFLPNSIVMAAPEAAIQKEQGASDCDWMAGLDLVEPGHDSRAKIRQFFMASPASGSIGVIKSWKGEALSGIATD